MDIPIKYQRSTSVILKGMRVPLFIGAHDFEKNSKQNVEIDIHIHFEDNYDIENDKLENSFDYDFVYSILKKHTSNINHICLQETLINLIANDIIKLDNRIKKLIVYSRKTEIYKDCESIGVKLEINKL